VSAASPGPPDIGIRQVRVEEWSAYRDLRFKALASDPMAFGSTAQREQALPPEHWQDRIRGSVESSGSVALIAVDSTGGFVGMVTAVDLEGTVHLFSMWVDPAYRGSGIGGRLLDAALAWIRRTHPEKPVVLEVNPHQAAAVHLYEVRGFQRTGKSSPLEHTPAERVIEMRWAPSGGGKLTG
jgi:ribosomal protein S18 acetylase RimI-like enzyme